MFRIILDLVAEILADVGALYKASEAVRYFTLLKANIVMFYTGRVGGHVMVLFAYIDK